MGAVGRGRKLRKPFRPVTVNRRPRRMRAVRGRYLIVVGLLVTAADGQDGSLK
jgi:hypothetical protein